MEVAVEVNLGEGEDRKREFPPPAALSSSTRSSGSEQLGSHTGEAAERVKYLLTFFFF